MFSYIFQQDFLPKIGSLAKNDTSVLNKKVGKKNGLSDKRIQLKFLEEIVKFLQKLSQFFFKNMTEISKFSKNLDL